MSCDQLYQKLDAICCDMSIFASDFEKKERDFNRKVKEFLSRKIEELYITPLKVKLLEKLGQKKEDFEKKMLSLAQMQDALRTFEKSIEHKQCSRRLLQQNVECKKVYQALLNLVAKKETLYREVLLVRPPVSKDAIDIIGKTGDSHCIKVGEALLNVPAGINHELLVAGELFAQPAPEKKSHLYKSFYSERFSPLWLVELFEPIQSVPPAYQEQKTHFERIFNDYFTAYMNRLLKEAIIYPLHLPLLQVARDELCGIKDDIKARFSENCKRDINNVLHALNNAIDYINSDSIEMKKVPIEQYGRGFVLSIDPYLEDVTQKYLEESIRRLEVLDEPLPPPVPVERPVVQISKKRKKVLTRRAEISTSVGLGGNPSVRITSDVILADHPELDIMGKSAPSPVVHINDDIPSLEDSYLFLTNLDKGNNTESISNVIYYLNSISYHIPSLKERVDAIHAGYYKKLNACLKKLSFCKYEIQAAKNRLNNKREYVEKWSVYNNEDFSETKSKLNDDVQSSLTEIAELEKNHAEIEAEDKINLLSFFSEVAALLKEECIVNNVQVLEYVQSLRSPHELDVSHQEVSEPDPSLDTNNKIIRAPRASYKKSGVIKIQTPPEIDFHEKKIREHIEKNRDYLVFCKVYEYLSNRKGYHKNIHAMIAEAKKIRNEKFREKIFKKIEDIRNQSKQLFIEALAAIGNFTELSAFQEKIATDWAPYLGLNEQQCGRDLVYYSFWSKINEVVRLLRDPNQLLDADDDARNYNAMCAVLNEIKFPNSLLSNPDNDSFAEAFHREINKLLYEKMQCLYAQRFETLCFQKLDAAFTAVKKQMSLGEREAVFDESKRAIENDPRFEACLDLLTYQQKIANFQRYLVEPTEEEKEEATRRDNVAIVAADHYILPASSAPFPLPGDRLQALREVRKNKTEEQALVVQREAESAAAVATELEKQRVCIETVKAIVQEIQSDTTCVRTISFFGWYISLGGKVKTVQELEHVIAKANGSELNAFSWLWFCQCIPFAEKVKTVEDTRNGKMPTVQQLLEPLRARHSRKYDWPHIGFRTDATKSKLADWESRLKELEEDTSYSKSLGV